MKLLANRKLKHFNPLKVENLETRLNPALPVLMVIADQQDFYYREYSDTHNSLVAAGVSVVVAATTTAPSTAHPNSGQGSGSGIVTPDIALSSVNAADYSAIVFVGGWGSSMYQYAFNDPDLNGSTDNYYFNGFYNGDTNLGDGIMAPQKIVVNNLINSFLAADKPTAGVCHGVTVLAWARVNGVSPLNGKHVAVPLTVGTPGMHYDGSDYAAGYALGQYQQVIANGAIASAVSGQYGNPNTVADDVIVDGRIITAENFDSAAYFGTVIAQQVIAADPAPRVTEVQINDGAAQRSRITSVRVTFSEAVNLPANANDAFLLTRTGPNGTGTVAFAPASVDNSSGHTVVTLNYLATGALVQSGSLVDGRYTLSVRADKVSDGFKPMDGNGDGTSGDDHNSSFHRLFGDANGDQRVDAADFGAFRNAFGLGGSIFDFNNDGSTNASDFSQFRMRFGTSI